MSDVMRRRRGEDGVEPTQGADYIRREDAIAAFDRAKLCETHRCRRDAHDILRSLPEVRRC